MDMIRLYEFMKAHIVEHKPNIFGTKEELETEAEYLTENYWEEYSFQLDINKLELEHRASEGWGLPCIHCAGTGTETYYENGAPHGAGYWAMPVSDICGYCLDKGICPNCANKLTEMDSPIICTRCNWNEINQNRQPEVNENKHFVSEVPNVCPYCNSTNFGEWHNHIGNVTCLDCNTVFKYKTDEMGCPIGCGIP